MDFKEWLEQQGCTVSSYSGDKDEHYAVVTTLDIVAPDGTAYCLPVLADSLAEMTVTARE